MSPAPDPSVIINAANAIWDLLEKNRPVYDIESDFANAVPKGASFQEMYGWRRVTRPHRFRISRGAAGLYLVDLIFKLEFMHDGCFMGRGLYIENACVLVEKRFIDIGQTVNVKVRAGNPWNAGSQADPEAAIEIYVDFDHQPFFLGRHGTSLSFVLFGNGRLVPR